MARPERKNILKKWSFVTLILIVFSLFVLNPVNAANIKVVKDAPDKIDFGELLEVNINIENFEDKEIVVYIEETISGAEPVNPKEFIISKVSNGK
ncbi:MAG: hypothetical protein KAU95_00695, partial [Candidatus Aenigmarchaeota archaeon]|nr:hypothetical protein [Candidatus Aenigmarchaeota archaeon]